MGEGTIDLIAKDRRVAKAKEAAKRLYENDYSEYHNEKDKRAADYKAIRHTINWLSNRKTLFSGRVAVPMLEAKIKEIEELNKSHLKVIENYHNYYTKEAKNK